MWLREMIETGWHRKPLEPEEKQALLDRLIEVFGFERYVEKAYLGQKMFSIEGLDTVVPMLDELFEMAHTEGADDVVIGMAHRGRLSVLAHNLGRPPASILAEFEGAKAIEAVKAVAAIPTGGTGDVKYHYGHSGSYTTRDGEEIGVRLYPNPSHLEFVDPVVTGAARAAQTKRDELDDRARPLGRGAGAAARRRRLPGAGRRRRDASTCSRWPATRPAARSTSSRTTRSGSRPSPRRPARPRTRPTWRRASTSRSSTSTPTTPRPASRRSAWRWPTASAGAATSSST